MLSIQLTNFVEAGTDEAGQRVFGRARHRRCSDPAP